MALSHEDKADVKNHLGAAIAKKVSGATKDSNWKEVPNRPHHSVSGASHSVAVKEPKLNSQMRNGQNDSDYAKSRAIHKRTGVPKHFRGNTDSEGGIPFGKKPK